MISAIHFSRRLTTGLLFLVALLVVTAALASQICDLDKFTDHGQLEHCCASLDEAAPGSPIAGATNEKLPDLPALLPVRSPERRVTGHPTAEIPPDRPPPSRSYHTRSSRILV